MDSLITVVINLEGKVFFFYFSNYLDLWNEKRRRFCY